jgi:hypothetical protein
MKNIFYNGNENIKKSGIPQKYTQEEIDEYQKCAEDVIYFIKNYVTIVTLDYGKRKFDLRDYQERMIQTYDANRFTICTTSRQIGKCVTDETLINICEKPQTGVRFIMRKLYEFVIKITKFRQPVV